MFVVSGLFLTAGAVQTVFQLRGLYVASAFIPLIAGLCLDRLFAVVGRADGDTTARTALLVAALALNAQVWLVAGRAGERIAGLAKANEDVSQASACSEPAAFGRVGALPAGTVLAPVDLGPYLLVHTHHAIVAAPYHRAIAGLTAGIAAVDGSEDELRRQAEATGAGYLVLCAANDEKTFPARLGRGEASAAWLEPIPLDASALKAWRIR